MRRAVCYDDGVTGSWHKVKDSFGVAEIAHVAVGLS